MDLIQLKETAFHWKPCLRYRKLKPEVSEEIKNLLVYKKKKVQVQQLKDNVYWCYPHQVHIALPFCSFCLQCRNDGNLKLYYSAE